MRPLCELVVICCFAAAVTFTTGCGEEPLTSSLEPDLPVDSQWSLELSADYSGGSLQILTGFVGPYGVTVGSDGSVYVSDLKEGRVVRFTQDLEFNGWLGMSNGDPSGWHPSGTPER
ncbi:MAG: hypothetical protein DRP45_07490, partial [Candidatus Zixiibacteriota bacterium]